MRLSGASSIALTVTAILTVPCTGFTAGPGAICAPLEGHRRTCLQAPIGRPLPARRPLLRRPQSAVRARVQLRMTAAEPVVEGDENDQGPMTAAQVAEEEARRDVTSVVEVMMRETPATMAPAPLGSLPPRLWLDNVDALLNEPVYKSVMYQRLESCSSEQELVLLEVVDERLLQFKKEQRDNRNKAKLEYIIGAALEGPQALDETLLDLCETRGLGDGLVLCLACLCACMHAYICACELTHTHSIILRPCESLLIDTACVHAYVHAWTCECTHACT